MEFGVADGAGTLLVLRVVFPRQKKGRRASFCEGEQDFQRCLPRHEGILSLQARERLWPVDEGDAAADARQCLAQGAGGGGMNIEQVKAIRQQCDRLDGVCGELARHGKAYDLLDDERLTAQYRNWSNEIARAVDGILRTLDVMTSDEVAKGRQLLFEVFDAALKQVMGGEFDDKAE